MLFYWLSSSCKTCLKIDEDDRLTLNVGRLGITTDPELAAITRGFGDPDFGPAEFPTDSEMSRLGVELETELCRDRRLASSAISSAGRRIGIFGVDSFSRNLTNASAMLTSTAPACKFRDGIMFRRYRRPYPGPSSPVLIRSSSSNPRTLAIRPRTSVFCFASAYNVTRQCQSDAKAGSSTTKTTLEVEKASYLKKNKNSKRQYFYIKEMPFLPIDLRKVNLLLNIVEMFHCCWRFCLLTM